VLENERILNAREDELRPELDRVEAELGRIQAKQTIVGGAAQP
jgi:hypothetical protein